MSQTISDQCGRFSAQLAPAAFLAWRLKLPATEFRFRGWLNTRAVPFPGDPERTCDTVAHLEPPGGEPWAVVIEFQTRPDPLMFARMMHYLSALWLAEKPDPEPGSRYNLGAVVINLTGVDHSSRNMRWAAAGMETVLTVNEGNLRDESAAELLAEIESGARPRELLPWIPLMQGAGESAIVEKWKVQASGEADDRLRSDYAALALVFAETAGRLELWTKALEGWNVQQSIVAERWIAQGEARGKAEGKSEGRVIGQAEMVVIILENRFGPVAVELADAILATTDADRLRQFGRAAARANSLDEFRSLAGL